MDRAGNLGAMGETWNQPLKYRDGFGVLWQVLHARPQPRQSAEHFCSFAYPNSPKIERFLPQSFRFDKLT